MRVVQEQQPVAAVQNPLAAPDWFVERAAELSRLMAATPKSVADGLWFELIKRDLVHPQPVPGKILSWGKRDSTDV